MKIISILMTAFLLSACQSDKTEIEDSSRVLANVGDKTVTEKYVAAFLFNRGVKEPTEIQFKQALDEVVKQQSLLLQAEKAGLSLTTEQMLSIQQLKDQAMSQLAIQDHLANNPVSEEEVKAEYDRIVTELKGTEYKLRHLLYQDEVQALLALDEINAGKAYLDKEKEYLAAIGPVQNVGDLGWVNIKQVPEPFHKPIQQMNDQQVHDQVVITQYGAHVIYLEAKRESAPPVYDEVKQGIRKTLEKKSTERYEQLAKVKAKVTVQQ